MIFFKIRLPLGRADDAVATLLLLESFETFFFLSFLSDLYFLSLNELSFFLSFLDLEFSYSEGLSRSLTNSAVISLSFILISFSISFLSLSLSFLASSLVIFLTGDRDLDLLDSVSDLLLNFS